MATGTSRLVRLDPCAGFEARRVELVLDCDSVALGASAAAAHRTLPPHRLHRTVVEYRRFHDLDRFGAVAVRDTDHGRSWTRHRELCVGRRADHDRGAGFRSAA